MLGTLLGWLRNEVDFPLRRRIRLRRRGCRLPAEDKSDLFRPEAEAEARRLVASYHLDGWARASGRTDFAASLFYLQMLERAFREAGVCLPSSVTALDAGCGDWFYVQALHALLARYGAMDGQGARQVRLDGVELDAFHLYAGFHSRLDWAETYAARLPGTRYIPGDIRAYPEPVDIAFMLFPFLFPTDLRRWGLPRRYLKPADLLRHVWSRVRPGGWLVIANLGPAERVAQQELLAAAGLQPVWHARHESPLYRYKQERYVTVLRR